MRLPSSVSNLSFASGTSAWVHQRLTRSTSAPFRARQMPVSGRLCGATAKGAAMMSRFPVAFRRTGVGFLDRPAPAGVGPPSRSVYRDKSLTPTGFSRSAWPRSGRGGRRDAYTSPRRPESSAAGRDDDRRGSAAGDPIFAAGTTRGSLSNEGPIVQRSPWFGIVVELARPGP